MTKTYAESKVEMEKTNIISDPNDVLGLQYNKYKSSLYSESLSKPSSYFKLKQDLEDKLKEYLVKAIFIKSFTNCLDTVLFQATTCAVI